MKILELRFCNLNSLYGGWRIDFRDPEYVSNGIFALTGPTGAGKSTILDALCLALYGSTPRLGKITKSGNDIMSRQTGECFAEVLFEAGAGLYRCHWSQHRSRRKAEGDLQAPRHEIAEGGGEGRVLENQLSRTARLIQDITGMDFDQFSRSILLAQGGFDTFLKADPEQKSRILEQITGTAVYTEISRAVHERLREEKEKLALLQAESSAFVLLTPEEAEALELELRALKKRDDETASLKKKTDAALLWRRSMEELRAEISALTGEAKRSEEDLAAFLPERTRLARSLRAAELEAPYAALSDLRGRMKADRARLVETGETLDRLNRDSEVHKQAFDRAAAATLDIRREMDESAPLRQKVRTLDQSLNLKALSLRKGEEDIRKDESLLEQYGQRKRDEQTRKKKAEESLASCLSYLEEHRADEDLASSLAVFEDQLDRLFHMSRELDSKKSALKSTAEKTAGAEERLKNNSAALEKSREKLALIRAGLDRVKKETEDRLAGRQLKEYRAEQETLRQEHLFRLRIAGLEGEREKLEDGRPCPLCGAVDHPYARGNFPRPDGTEVRIGQISLIIGRAEELETSRRGLESEEKTALQELAEAEKLDAGDNSELNAARKSLQELNDAARKGEEELKALEQSLLERLHPFGIRELPRQPSDVTASLRNRLSLWREMTGRREETERLISRIEGEITGQEALIEAGRTGLEGKKAARTTLEQEIREERDRRRELFGDRDPDAEEHRLREALKKAEELSDGMRAAYEEGERKILSAGTLRRELASRTAAGAKELEALESGFPGRLTSAGFGNEEEYLTARLSSGERESLESRARALDERQSGLTLRLKDRRDRLQKEEDKELSPLDLTSLEEESGDLQKTLDGIRDSMAALKHRLGENASAGERLKEKQRTMEALRKECLRWEKLHGLIGSADGKKFRNFAQGLTFEIMVSHANRQLGRMTDRYLLLRDRTEPLELNVMDNYQAGEIRSTRNLSGGESFIISLSLALGLSGMAGRKVRVDSLFLDEGFGTLDEDALETALETLSSLQREGKLIGVISHVPALKERISTQIGISPLSGGKSVISGPGCSRVPSPSGKD